MSSRYRRGSLRREKRAGKKEVWVWRYRSKGIMKQEIPRNINPMSLVKVRGGTRRVKKIVLLTYDQANLLIENLWFPYNEVALTGAMLGGRIEEILALQ